MRIKIILRSLCFVSLASTSVCQNQNICGLNNDPNVKFSYLKESIQDWKDSNCYLDFSFTHSNSRYNLYSLSKNDEYKGYFITDNLNNVESMYVGSDEPSRNNISSISPIFATNGSIIENDEENINTASLNSLYHEPPTLIADLYTSYSSSFGGEQKLTNCPTYFNPTNYSCVPTAAAMLFSFYDRYSYLSNLYWGLLPLEHDDDTSTVDAFITNLGNNYFETTTGGTTTQNTELGLDNYFNDKGYGDYACYYLTKFDDYSDFFTKHKQPTLIWISVPGQSYKHAILGIGTANTNGGGRFIVCHYGERGSGLGDYYVNESRFGRYYYIGKTKIS